MRIRNADKAHHREVLYYEVLPWFIKPHLHSLSMNVELDEYGELRCVSFPLLELC